MKPPFLIDTHAHLDLFDPTDLPGVMSRADAAGVGHIVSVAIDARSSSWAAAFAADNPGVSATIGVHPHDARNVDADVMKKLKKLGSKSRVVAVGETGLDYFRMRAPKALQIDAFQRHLELAAELDLPVIIHCRDAYDDMVMILARTRPAKAVLHCFSGQAEHAAAFLKLGCFISLTGTVTFKNAVSLQEITAGIPMDRLLLETDAPYLAPQPYRGQRNEPAYIRETAAKIAELKKVPLEQVVKKTAANADMFFSLDL